MNVIGRLLVNSSIAKFLSNNGPFTLKSILLLHQTPKSNFYFIKNCCFGHQNWPHKALNFANCFLHLFHKNVVKIYKIRKKIEVQKF